MKARQFTQTANNFGASVSSAVYPALVRASQRPGSLVLSVLREVQAATSNITDPNLKTFADFCIYLPSKVAVEGGAKLVLRGMKLDGMDEATPNANTIYVAGNRIANVLIALGKTVYEGVFHIDRQESSSATAEFNVEGTTVSVTRGGGAVADGCLADAVMKAVIEPSIPAIGLGTLLDGVLTAIDSGRYPTSGDATFEGAVVIFVNEANAKITVIHGLEDFADVFALDATPTVGLSQNELIAAIVNGDAIGPKKDGQDAVVHAAANGFAVTQFPVFADLVMEIEGKDPVSSVATPVKSTFLGG